MTYEIKRKITGEVLYRSETASDVRECLVEGVKAGANLADAYLARANLAGANLADAYLARANLAGANLADANLADANLADAYLAGANLADAYLAGANLADAYLARANLSGANLKDAKHAALIYARTEIVPREGEVIGWKKCRNSVIAKLRVPPDAKRSNATGRKCRAEFVEVLELSQGDVAKSIHDGTTEYRVGSRVVCDSWDDNRFNECAGGIHFYLTKEEAEAHC